MPIVKITSLEQPGVEVYGNLTEKQLRHQYEHGNGIFIVESPKVITRALDAGYQLCPCFARNAMWRAMRQR